MFLKFVAQPAYEIFATMKLSQITVQTKNEEAWELVNHGITEC